MSQSQSSQGDRSPNIQDVGRDVKIDASQEYRSVQIDNNAVKGAVSVNENRFASEAIAV
ncbi:MAG: hypothetical protein J7647_27715 [Cyanobacteria bacterium SBLK]|nr:hypothetical protein [Cyanobacteria bacterium SBLK]